MNLIIQLLSVLLLIADLTAQIRCITPHNDDAAQSAPHQQQHPTTTTAAIRNRRIFPDVVGGSAAAKTPTATTTTTTTPTFLSTSNGRNGESTFGLKTPKIADVVDEPETSGTRTIQRMVGGHLHHPAYRKYEEIAVTRKNTRLSKVYFHKRTENASIATSTSTTTTTTTVRPTRMRLPPTSTTVRSVAQSDRVFVVTPMNAAAAATADYATGDDADHRHRDTGEDDDDAGLLSDDNRLDTAWSNRYRTSLIASASGAGTEKAVATASPKAANNAASSKDDSKKTLADQVADGKYGLIQTELFASAPRRPGILSYAPNAEVPADTAANLGGLHDDDIWLAEDHLLVLKGGGLSSQHAHEPWRPIDDYQAPQRQVRLPENPKVPPPFLVQLDDGGPVQFVGNHQLPLINPFTNESLLLFPGRGPGFPEAGPHNTDQANVFARPRPAGAAPAAAAKTPAVADASAEKPSQPQHHHQQGYQYLPPLPPWLSDSETNHTADPEPGVHPLYMLPPIMRLPFPPPRGSLDDTANNNGSFPADQFDEDDPALYYPPPYSFQYDSNYTNPVPPGPLVPGIVLPPPPNFFARANPANKTQAKTAQQQTVRTSTARPVTRVYKPISRGPTTTTSTSSTTTSTSTAKTSTQPATTTTPAYSTSSTPQSTTKLHTTTTTTTHRPHQQPAQPIRTIARPVYITTTPPTQAPVPPRTVTQLRKVVASRPQQQQQPRHEETSLAPAPVDVFKFISKDQPQKGHPVYYEYFDARNNPPVTKQRLKVAGAPSTTSTTTSTAATTTSSSSTTTPRTTTTPVKTIKLKPHPQRAQQTPTTQLHPQKPPKQQRPSNAYLPLQPFDYDRYIYITPKPEIIPNGISNDVLNFHDGAGGRNADDDDGADNEPELVPLRKVPSRPIESFSREVDSIRQTLQFYRKPAVTVANSSPDASEPNDADYYAPTHISTTARIPKAKAVYEYSFEASTGAPLAPSALKGGGGSESAHKIAFLPPAKYDTAPFKPMVHYSAPLDEDGGFQAMPPVSPAPSVAVLEPTVVSIGTTAQPPLTAPVQPQSAGLYAVTNRGHGARNYKDPSSLSSAALVGHRVNQFASYYPTRRPATHYDYGAVRFPGVSGPDEAAVVTSTPAAPNWVSIEKQILRQIHLQQQQQQQQQQHQPHHFGHHPKEINVQIQPASSLDPYDQSYRPRSNNYYHYPQTQPQLPSQPYFRPAHLDRRQQQLQQYTNYPQQPHQHHQQQSVQSNIDFDLTNDTAVNYVNPRPPLNPDAEFIDPSAYALLAGTSLPGQQHHYYTGQQPQQQQQQRPVYHGHTTQQQQQQQSQPPQPQPQYPQYPQQPQQQQPPQFPFPPPPLPTRTPNGNRYYPPTFGQNGPPPHSLAKDLLVNYKLPLPHQNINAEYLPEERFRRFYNGPQPVPQQQPPQMQRLQQQQQQQQQQQALEAGATNVAMNLSGMSTSSNGNSGVVRYKLPGEPEANVFFYTPQSQRRQQQQQQQSAMMQSPTAQRNN